MATSGKMIGRKGAHKPQAGSSRQRGRPAAGRGKNVPDDLLDAMRACLQERIPAEITLREVAERADTSQEMVRYYFGSKDGLVVALMRQTADRFASVLAQLEEDILDLDGNPTRHLVTTLLKMYVDSRYIGRISNIEFQKAKSALREDFLDNRAELVIGSIHAILMKLRDAGIYRSDIDYRKMAMTVMNMVGGPVSLLPALSPNWITADGLLSESWAEHLCDFIDAHCRPAPR